MSSFTKHGIRRVFWCSIPHMVYTRFQYGFKICDNIKVTMRKCSSYWLRWTSRSTDIACVCHSWVREAQANPPQKNLKQKTIYEVNSKVPTNIYTVDTGTYMSLVGVTQQLQEKCIHRAFAPRIFPFRVQ